MGHGAVEVTRDALRSKRGPSNRKGTSGSNLSVSLSPSLAWLLTRLAESTGLVVLLGCPVLTQTAARYGWWQFQSTSSHCICGKVHFFFVDRCLSKAVKLSVCGDNGFTEVCMPGRH